MKKIILLILISLFTNYIFSQKEIKDLREGNKYYNEHKEEINAQRRDKHVKKPKKQKLTIEQNKERDKKYAETHKEQRKENRRCYYENHKNIEIERANKYNKEHNTAN